MTQRRLAAAVAGGAALYTGAIYLVATADLGEPRALAAMVTIAGVVFAVAGTIAALRRPDSRTGAQMLAVGFLWSLGALQLVDSPLVFTIGYVVSALAFVAVAHLVLAYPTGRLPPGDEWIVWTVLAIVTLGPLAISLVDPEPVPGCADCPENAFLVTDRPALAQAAAIALGLSAGTIAAVVFVRLVRRFHAASPPLRRVVGPVYLFTLLALIGLVMSNVVWTFDARAGLAIELAAVAALALMPVAFLVGILRTRLRRAGIADLVIALGNGRPLRDAIADALGDPSLGLAYWSAQRQAWVDEEGRTMAEPIARGAYAATFIENDGKRVAALLHDRSLADQHALVDAVAATAALAFEKERLQAELRAQYRFLETIIDTAPSLLSVVDTEGRIRVFNHAVEVASGLDDRTLVDGRYFWEIFIDPAEREAMVERFRDAAPAFPAASYENVFTNALGEEHVIAWQTAPLVDRNGDVVRIVAGGIDITDRKRREVELERQWDFATTVANTIPSFIVVVDHDGVVGSSGANRAFCTAFGRSESELEGTSFLELVARDDAPAARLAIDGAANGEPQAERESRWLVRGGGERTVAWTATPITDPAGRARVLVSGADVTDRKRQEAEVRASRSRIVAATDAARRRLERNLHDGAQQRLAALSLSLRLAESRLPDDPDKAIELLAASRAELGQALDELRELARGLHPNVLTDRGLGPALEALVLRSPIPVDVVVPAERFPPAIEVATYYVAAEALANVAKYAGATSATVRFDKDGEQEAFVIEVVDDGVGGADPTRGSGLEGLLDRIASLDGTLSLTSPEGGGTRVRVTIPFAPEGPPVEAGRAPEQPAPYP